MATEPFHYRTCIVRAWQESSRHANHPIWRLTLEVPSEGVRQGYQTREQLVESLLRYLFDEPADPPELDSCDPS